LRYLTLNVSHCSYTKKGNCYLRTKMTFQFKIKLNNITNPPVWRRLVVPGNFTFNQFHYIIQDAFGWDNYHLFSFSPGGFTTYPVISDPEMYDEDEEDIIDSDEITLAEIFKAEGQKFSYLYDFGDYWLHSITVEKLIDITLETADCTGGKGACPPEDCGGAPGYQHLKQILADPKNPEHESMKEWLGLEPNEKWDADYFDLEEAQEAVREI
jgi:hypothetical protein